MSKKKLNKNSIKIAKDAVKNMRKDVAIRFLKGMLIYDKDSPTSKEIEKMKNKLEKEKRENDE